MTNGDTLDLLQAAKERLFTKGWMKGSLGLPSGSNCLMGAVCYASKGFPLTYPSIEHGAYDALEWTIGGKIDEFNDHPDTSFDDVVDAIDRTIKRLVMESE